MPLPSFAGQWAISLSGSTTAPGGVTGNYTFTNGQVTGPPPFSSQFHPYFTLGGGQCGLTYTSNGNISMSVTAKLTWTPSAPGDTSQPPPTVDVLETGGAGSGVGLNNPTSVNTTADDGLGDAPTYPAPSYYGAQSSGKHLIHLTVAAGQTSVTLPTRSLSAALSWSPATANMGAPGMSMGYTVQLDNRNVAISSSLEPTFYKDPKTGLPAQNVRAGNGFMVADTVSPDPSAAQSIGYTPLYTRSAWGTSSNYQWTFASGGSSIDPQSGTFNTIIYDVSSPELTYYSTTSKPGSSEYVTLKLTDSKDGASASNNYSILFHGAYEQWQRKTVIRHPVALVKGGMNDTHPDWTYLTMISNGGSQNLVQNLTSAVTLSTTQTGTIGGQQTLTPAAVAAFQFNESITNGKTYTYAYTTQNTFTGGPHTITQFFAAMSYESRAGTADNYALNGFQGNVGWQGVWTSGAVSLGSLEWPN